MQRIDSISFRVLNSSTGIPLYPLALLTAVLSKAHLTSHSRMFGTGWLTTLSWLSGSLRPILYSSSMYSFHLFLISSASSRSLLLRSFICAHLWAKCSHNISNFPEEIASLSPSVVFLYFKLCSWKKALFLPAILWYSAFSYIYISFSLLLFTSLSSAICKSSLDNHFAFLLFSGMIFCPLPFPLLMLKVLLSCTS